MSERKKILRQVKEFYLNQPKDKFIPGKSNILYGGRVYDWKEMSYLVDSALDFWLTSGRYTDRFEAGLAKFLGVKHCLLVNSGSSANLLAISALTSPLLKDRRLKPGDEVITTACGFPTTLNPILQNNLIPIFADVGLNCNIKVDQIEPLITKKTKAIFIPHALGNPANMKIIMRIVKRHKLWLIEDNCDALGSKYKGKYTGTFGDLSTCSFFPAHHITMGEGGAVLTNNPLLKKIVASLRDWGRDCYCKPGANNTCGRRFTQRFPGLPCGYDHKYIYSHIGYNLKATEMQAAIGCAQLKKLPRFIRKRKSNFKALYNIFRKHYQYFILPEINKDKDPSWFGFPILIHPFSRFSRMDLVNYLEKHKIHTRMMFGGNLIKQPAYKDMEYRSGNLNNTGLIMHNLFWIGVYPGINGKMLHYIKKTVDKFIEENTNA